MSWTRVFAVALLTFLLILTISIVSESAAVRDNARAGDAKGEPRRVFMPESDASNFFKRRSRRSPKYYAEYQAEQRVQRANLERWREHNEERRNRYENYAEEDRDESNERSRETNEQVREYNYDGQYPRYYWFH